MNYKYWLDYNYTSAYALANDLHDHCQFADVQSMTKLERLRKLNGISSEFGEIYDAIRRRFDFTILPSHMSELLSSESPEVFAELYKRYAKGSIEEEVSDLFCKTLHMLYLDNALLYEDIATNIDDLIVKAETDSDFQNEEALLYDMLLVQAQFCSDSYIYGPKYLMSALTVLVFAVKLSKYYKIDWLLHIKLKMAYISIVKPTTAAYY
jgi:hypothetical protein